MRDFYLRADTREGMLADLEQLNLGLTMDGEFIDASHSHALAYIGEIAGASGIHANLRTLTYDLAQAIETTQFEHTAFVEPEHPVCGWAE